MRCQKQKDEKIYNVAQFLSVFISSTKSKPAKLMLLLVCSTKNHLCSPKRILFQSGVRLQCTNSFLFLVFPFILLIRKGSMFSYIFIMVAEVLVGSAAPTTPREPTYSSRTRLKVPPSLLPTKPFFKYTIITVVLQKSAQAIKIEAQHQVGCASLLTSR